MRSLIAALRNLTLPNGATSGTRIVLNADKGVILLFNSDDQLIASIAPADAADGSYLAGITAYALLVDDPPFSESTVINISGPQITFNTGREETPSFTVPGLIQADDSGSDRPAFFRVRGPSYSQTKKTAELFFESSPPDDSANPIIHVIQSDQSGEGNDPCDLIVTGTVYSTHPNGLGMGAEEWQDADIENGGTTPASVPLQYRRMPDGNVVIRGEVDGGTIASGQTIFTLPAAYRPPNELRINNLAGSGSSFSMWVTRIQPTGVVGFLAPPAQTSFRFDGTIFSTLP